MVPTQLQQIVAEALDVPQPSVAFHARRLREAGFLTKGGRGRSAPSMRPTDAARLAFAVVASEQGMDSATVLHDFSEFATVPNSCTGKILEQLGGVDLNALAAVESLFRGLANGSFADAMHRIDPQANLDRELYLMVRLRGAVRAVGIGFQSSRTIGQCIFLEGRSVVPSGYERVHRIFGHTLMSIAKAFRS